MSYLFWELSRRSDIMKKLQAELDDAMPDRRVLPDAFVLANLPYLNAFLKEGAIFYLIMLNGEPIFLHFRLATVRRRAISARTCCSFDNCL